MDLERAVPFDQLTDEETDRVTGRLMDYAEAVLRKMGEGEAAASEVRAVAIKVLSIHHHVEPLEAHEMGQQIWDAVASQARR